MDTREAISVRRAYNRSRQTQTVAERLSFEELALLCFLREKSGSFIASALAETQHVLRPTMTHRLAHLEEHGYITREIDLRDRRAIRCAITDEGQEAVVRLTTEMTKQIEHGQPLGRATAARLEHYVTALGSSYIKVSDLILMCISLDEDRAFVTTGYLANALGVLQPTVTMSLKKLQKQGYIKRGPVGDDVPDVHRRSVHIMLTESGETRAEEIKQLVGSLKITRNTK